MYEVECHFLENGISIYVVGHLLVRRLPDSYDVSIEVKWEFSTSFSILVLSKYLQVVDNKRDIHGQHRRCMQRTQERNRVRVLLIMLNR